MGEVFFQLFCDAETYVANQIPTIGHENYSSQMCLYALLKCAYLSLDILFVCVLSSFSERGVGLKIRVKCIHTNVVTNKDHVRGGLYVNGCNLTLRILES